MTKQCFEFIGCGGAVLPAVLWLPEQDVKAVLQITHGMTDSRYK